MKRRDFFKTCGIAGAGAMLMPGASLDAFAGEIKSSSEASASDVWFGDVSSINGKVGSIRPLKAQTDHQLTAILIGAGARGNTYARYAEMFPEAIKIVGVSDINDYRRIKLAEQFGIPEDRRYGDFSEILAVPKFADACIICTPDDVHYAPAMKAMKLGYHVLVEKPIAPTEQECRDILAMSRKSGLVVGTCHVLRYSPYFIAMKDVLDKGMIGELVSIQHMEPVQFQHMAHSYVRGNWRSSKETTPMILAKSCHDLDIIRWLIGRKCETISADGGLYLFKAENAPQGAPARCTDGCPYESSCPYSAIEIYVREKKHTYVFDIPDKYDETALMEQIKTGDYGRCVYHCDNDQPDHYVCGMTFEGGKTAAFSMEAFSPTGGRRTRIMGTMGYVEGDGNTFSVYDFRTQKKYIWDMKIDDIPEYKGSGHGGGDLALFRDFVEAAATGDPSHLSSTIDVSIESHLIGFLAEKSRHSHRKVNV